MRRKCSTEEAEMKRTMMLLVVALLAVSAMAQEKPAGKTGKPADKKAPATQGGMSPAAKPSPEMQKIAKMLVGKWTAVTKTEPMGGMPGGEAKGEARTDIHIFHDRY